MSKAILEFNLPEEESEYRSANQGQNMRWAIWEFYNQLRSKYKHMEYKTDEAEYLI